MTHSVGVAALAIMPDYLGISWPTPVDVQLGLDAANLLANVVIALATIATLIWAVSSTRRQLSLAKDEVMLARSERAAQNKERVRQAMRDRQQQAEHVAAWTEQEFIRETVGEDDDGRPIEPVVDFRRKVMLVNTSNAPVWDVTVDYLWAEGMGNTKWRLPILVPTAQPQEEWAPGLPSDSDESRLVAVRFRDAAGRVWRRDQAGELHLVKDPQARPGRTSAPSQH